MKTYIKLVIILFLMQLGPINLLGQLLYITDVKICGNTGVSNHYAGDEFELVFDFSKASSVPAPTSIDVKISIVEPGNTQQPIVIQTNHTVVLNTFISGMSYNNTTGPLQIPINLAAAGFKEYRIELSSNSAIWNGWNTNDIHDINGTPNCTNCSSYTNYQVSAGTNMSLSVSYAATDGWINHTSSDKIAFTAYISNPGGSPVKIGEKFIGEIKADCSEPNITKNYTIAAQIPSNYTGDCDSRTVTVVWDSYQKVVDKNELNAGAFVSFPVQLKGLPSCISSSPIKSEYHGETKVACTGNYIVNSGNGFIEHVGSEAVILYSGVHIQNGTNYYHARIDPCNSGSRSNEGMQLFGEVNSEERVFDVEPEANEINSLNSISLFPNPTGDYFSISGDEIDRFSEIKIFDLQGSEVFSSKIETGMNYDVTFLSSGFYTVQLSSDNSTQLIKLIKD